jgi:Cu2+-exporting ATPase
LIHQLGLDPYYQSADRRETPVEPTGRQYAELDDVTFQLHHARDVGGGIREIDLYLDNVHCASCVWLVERAPLAVPGAIAAELDVPRSLATIRWDPARTTLSAIARFLDQVGYPAHPYRDAKADTLRRNEDRAMLARIGVAGAIAVNVMSVALALYAGWFGGMEASVASYFRWISLCLTIPAIAGPGRVFFRGAWSAIRARRLHLDIPIAIALGAGFVRGAANTIADSGPIYFDGVVTLIFLLLVGRFLQQRAQRAAADSAELLRALTPATARLVLRDEVREVPAESLVPDQVVLVRAGDTLPADGEIVAGDSTIDWSILSGESRPVRVSAPGRVYAGTVNLGAALWVRVTKAGETTRLAQILAQLESGIRRRAPVVLAADRLAGWFVATVLLIAAATWLGWHRIDATAALDHAIAVLIVTCPCALALATPLAITVAVGRAAKAGMLIRSGAALELLSRPGRLILDKTGTVTEGKMAVLEWQGSKQVRGAVLALERHSSHPIAAALAEAWPAVPVPEAEHVEQTMGGGITGRVDGREICVGSPAFVRQRASDPANLAGSIRHYLTPVVVAVDGVVVAAAGIGDRIRSGAESTLSELRRRGWTIELLSGDAPSVVAAAARALGIPPDLARGGATPEAKLDIVGQRLRSGPVVMVGDGVNDAPAMGRATVGIGVRGGAEACLAAADVFLATPGLGGLTGLLEGAERTMRVIRTAIGLSLGYNLVAAGLAVAGLVNPLLAAILMPASSISVVVLAWRARTFGAQR